MNWIKSFALIFLTTLYGCGGVNYSLSGINIPPEVKTVSVKLFVNKAPINQSIIGTGLYRKIER